MVRCSYDRERRSEVVGSRDERNGGATVRGDGGPRVIGNNVVGVRVGEVSGGGGDSGEGALWETHTEEGEGQTETIFITIRSAYTKSSFIVYYPSSDNIEHREINARNGHGNVHPTHPTHPRHVSCLHTHTHTHTHGAAGSGCVCVCVCVCEATKTN